MIKIFNNTFRKHSYLIYLATLVFWIGFLPLLEITGIVEQLELIVALIITLSSYFFFSQNKKRIQAYFLAPATFFSILISFFLPDNELLNQSVKLLLFTLFLFVTIHFFAKIFRHKFVDKELIYIAIAAYIMIGLMSSILCWFTYNYYPGSYNAEIDNYGPILDFTYYSIVTMSTLGYGDILPLLPQSKSLAIVITLFGQFYMAVLMAFLVGKFLNQERKK